jgi:hypothetical protein
VVALGLFAVLTVTALRRGRPGRSTLGWVTLFVAATTLVIATTAGAALLGMTAVTGVPLRGGIGDRHWTPTSTAELREHYRLAIGEMDLDLRDVDLPAGTTRVHASVAIGRLAVRVPMGVDVTVTGHTGVGDVVVFGDQDSGMSADRQRVVTEGSDRRLVIDAHTGIGEVDIVRANEPLRPSR